MQIFKNRPFALFCCLFAILSAGLLILDLREKLCVLIVCLFLCVGAILFLCFLPQIKKKSLYLLSAGLGAALACTVSILFFNCYFAHCQENTYEEAVIEGTVLERVSAGAEYTGFRLQLDAIDGRKNGERVILECDFPSTLQVGDRIEAQVTQCAFSEEEDFSEALYYLADGYTRIYACDADSDYSISPEKSRSLGVLFRAWNHRLSLRVYDAVGGESGALSVALLLGNRSLLSDDTTLSFRRAGVAHILALSGMHVSAIIGFLELILRRMRIAKLIRALTVPSVLIGYLLLTGFSPSTVRAVMMVCMLYLGFLLCAHYDSFTALSLILAAMLVVTPYAVLDLSLWMSFIAAVSVLVFYPVVRAACRAVEGKRRCFLRRAAAGLTKALLVGLVSNAGLLPLMGLYLGEWSIATIPATLLLFVPMAGLLIASLFVLLFSEFFFFTYVCRFLSQIMLEVAEWASERRSVLCSFASEVELWILIGFAFLLAVLATVRVRHRVLFAIVPIIMLLSVLFSSYLTAHKARVYMPTSEQTGNFYLLCEGGELIVVDDAKTDENDLFRLLALAETERCTEIGDLVLCNYEDRHSYLISRLAAKIKIRRLHLPMPKNNGERAIAARLEDEARLHGIDVCYDVSNLCIPDAKNPYAWEYDPPMELITVQ